ncbi:MAG: TonB-dependent receptor [Bacteroidota bacterium]|nr:TonB-dependent receptor [Bacteroidota bacterium]
MTNLLQIISKQDRFAKRIALLAFLLVSYAVSAQQQKVNIQGKVLDENSKTPLVGANIKVNDSKGEQISGLTDISGSFSIAVKSLPVSLKVSIVGFQEQDVEVYEYTEPFSVYLAQDLNLLKSVVVVGYGTQKRKELTGAIASVPNTFLTQPSTTSFDNALGGAVAGLNVTQSSGQPGSTSSLRIRGGNSITGGNEPLYVIDGYILYNNNSTTRTGAGNFDGGLNPLSSINTSDIESIEVLKDVSATAIYGSRGANGVIIITTKKGSKGTDNITYQTTFGFQKIRKKLDLLNGKQWAQLYTELKQNRGETGFTDAQINSFGQGEDWQSAALQSGTSQNHQLTFIGGDKKSRYLLSGNYTDQSGIIKNTDYQKINARINYDRTVSESFTVGLNASGTSSTQNGLANYGTLTPPGRLSNPYDLAVRTSPLVSVYNADGSFNYSNPYETGDIRLGDVTVNGISDIVNTTAETKLTNVFGNFYANYTIVPSLVAKAILGADLNSAKQNFYAPKNSAVGLIPKGLASVGFKKSGTWQAAFTLNYNKTVKDHSIEALAGYTTQKTNVEYATATSSNFSNESLTYTSLAAGSTYGAPTSGGSESILNSYIARVNYTFKDRYNVTATIRADGSSRFASSHRWGYFPSLGLSWNINQEPFFKFKTINNLKLRLSAGTVGNQEIGDYKYLATYSAATNVSFGGTLVTDYTRSRLANPDLKWESTSQYNAGLDLGLWNDKLNFVVDVYSKKTSDLLVDIPVPITTGFTSQLQNVGSVTNKGIEFAVNGVILKNKSANWTVSANIAHNVNKVTSLGSIKSFQPTFTTDNSSTPLATILPLLVKVGEPLGTFYGYQFAGVVQTGEESSTPVPSWYSKVTAGDPKWVDQNGDKKITEDDKVVLGNSQPKFTYGFSTSFSYKRFDVSLLFQGSYGNKLYNGLRQNLESYSSTYNVSSTVLQRWTSSNPSKTVPRANEVSSVYLDSRYIEDASFLKLKSLTIGYTLPFKITSNKNSKVRIYASAQNLLTITNYKGYDPEASRYGGDETNGLYQGIDLGAYPSSTGFNIGASVTF